MSSHATIVRPWAGLAIVGLCATFAGCTRSSWNTALLPEDVSISTLQPASVTPIAGKTLAELASTGGEMPTPTVTGLDRSAWATTVMYSPPPGVDHGPLYYKTFALGTPIARDRGEYPTIDTCLQTETPDDDWTRIGETAMQPLIASLDVALMPVRFIRTPSWQRVKTRVEGYERVPTADVYVEGSLVEPLPTGPAAEPAPSTAPAAAPASTSTSSTMTPMSATPAAAPSQPTRPLTP
jgi:hypothetical protein